MAARLAICLAMMTGCCEEVTTISSQANHRAALAVASDELVAVSWTTGDAPGLYTFGGGVAMLSLAGELLGTAQLPQNAAARGVAGSTTSLWYGIENIASSPGPVVASLVASDKSTPLAITTDEATQVVGIHDGAAYQLLWRTGGFTRHRTIFEDGTLGPVLETTFGVFEKPYSVIAASDGAGAIYVLVVVAIQAGGGAYVVRLDTTTGTTESVWNEPSEANWLFEDAFFFAGELHLRGSPPNAPSHLLSIDPVTRASRSRPLDPDVAAYGNRIEPGATQLVVPSRNNIVYVLDASLAIIDREPAATTDKRYAAVATDYVYTDLTPTDEDAREPGYIEVVRRDPAADGEVWRQRVVTNSEVLVRTECLERGRGCGQVAPGSGLGVVLALLGMGARRRRARARCRRT